MAFSTGFYADECSVYYECAIEDGEKGFEKPKVNLLDPKRYDFKSSFVGFIYVYSGKLTVYHCGEFITLPEKTLLVCSPDYPFKFVKSVKNTELVTVHFHTSIVNVYKKANDLFKIFYTDDVKKRIYTPKMHENNIIVPLLNSLKANILQHYPEPFVYSRIATIVTELNTIYDRCFGAEKEIPSQVARLLDYMDRHYTEKLTIEFLSEKLAISPSSIHRICKKALDKTFKEHITCLRLREARALIVKNNVLPSKAAKICGYDDYSSFFRAYKKEYGVSPANDVSSKTRWPMT